MNSMNFTEPICLKELRLLKNNTRPLSEYYSFNSEAIKLNDCQNLPPILGSNLAFSQTVKSLLRLPSNNIMIVIMVILESAYQDTKQQMLLNKIKTFAYDQNLILLDLVEISERGKYNQMMIKKLFVQFFHLAALNKSKNKIEKLMYKYPIMQCSFILLCRKLLSMKGVSDADNLQLPIPTIWIVQTLCNIFKINYKIINNSIYEIQGKLLAQDSSNVYKICEKQVPFLDDNASNQQKIFKLLDENDEQSISNSMVNTLSSSRLVYSRPQSRAKVFAVKGDQIRPQSSTLFPRKNLKVFNNIKTAQSSTPLSFGKIKQKSSTQITDFSCANYFSTQPSNSYVNVEKSLNTQRSNSINNILKIQNKGQDFVLPISKQKSYGYISQHKYQSFSPERRRPQNIQNRVESTHGTSNPLAAYFDRSYLNKQYKFPDKKWQRNIQKTDNYRYDTQSYQYGY